MRPIWSIEMIWNVYLPNCYGVKNMWINGMLKAWDIDLHQWYPGSWTLVTRPSMACFFFFPDLLTPKFQRVAGKENITRKRLDLRLENIVSKLIQTVSESELQSQQPLNKQRQPECIHLKHIYFRRICRIRRISLICSWANYAERNVSTKSRSFLSSLWVTDQRACVRFV